MSKKESSPETLKSEEFDAQQAPISELTDEYIEWLVEGLEYPNDARAAFYGLWRATNLSEKRDRK